MPVKLSPLNEEDIPTIVRLQLDAFKDHPRTPIMWPNGYTDDLYAYEESSSLKGFHDPKCPYIKAVDEETGEIVGISEWTFKLDPVADAANYTQDFAAYEKEQPPSNWPEGGNWELRKYYKINLRKLLKEFFDGQAFIFLDVLTVNPKVQAKGIGSQLLEWGVRQADEKGIMMGLESTPAGLALYKKYGFVEARAIKADMRIYGWTGPYDEEAFKRVWMVREPQSCH